ncbi:MAG TPA: hypothetical protein DCR58_07400 [Idiomarina baltica]|uniref:Uncharacterized protein n=1 Tax=Idiomarina baltica TaxID=190892 RepID=A0A348WPY3_9GAMM|nr:hypothetical protein [Idiomarina baltica]
MTLDDAGACSIFISALAITFADTTKPATIEIKRFIILTPNLEAYLMSRTRVSKGCITVKLFLL